MRYQYQGAVYLDDIKFSAFVDMSDTSVDSTIQANAGNPAGGLAEEKAKGPLKYFGSSRVDSVWFWAAVESNREGVVACHTSCDIPVFMECECL